ncbi:MAG: hypothetical protein FJY77_00265 [Candidatus Altiarchaeales archaeon]|nr:hypothetical protein [Candidatus Altiarchaeales archaeon]
MDFRKVTISLPESLYDEAMGLVRRGLFSNFSDLVRSGIREEFKGLRPVVADLDEKMIYGDINLVAGVKQSMKEAKAGRGRIFKSDKELDEYFRKL